MVDYLVGTVAQVQEQEIVLDVGIVGITLFVPSGRSFVQGSTVKIYSHLHWNSENGPSLFGFNDVLERSVFRIVTSCSGIGPKIALAILADLGTQAFLHAISTGNDQELSKVSGIGKKKAEQIAVQLKHKVAALLETGVILGNVQEISHIHDVCQALQSLNYSRQEINRAMEFMRKNGNLSGISFDVLLRQALAYLAKQL
jgi:Holliday junction DNA helicase RuvA